MPNIEIHGLVQQAAFEVRRRMFDLFLGDPCVNEMVVTVFSTHVMDRQGLLQPFLRLLSSCEDDVPRIIEKLQKLGFDIEHVKVKGFYPKQV